MTADPVEQIAKSRGALHGEGIAGISGGFGTFNVRGHAPVGVSKGKQRHAPEPGKCFCGENRFGGKGTQGKEENLRQAVGVQVPRGYMPFGFVPVAGRVVLGKDALRGDGFKKSPCFGIQ